MGRYKVDCFKERSADVNPYMHLFGKEGERRPLTWKSGPAQKNESCSYCGAGEADVGNNGGCSTVSEVSNPVSVYGDDHRC